MPMARVKLTTACSRGDPRGVYEALRYDMARKLEACESGRDYAAIAKSLIDVQEKLDEMGERASSSRAREASALAKARERHLRVVGG